MNKPRKPSEPYKPTEPESHIDVEFEVELSNFEKLNIKELVTLVEKDLKVYLENSGYEFEDGIKERMLGAVIFVDDLRFSYAENYYSDYDNFSVHWKLPYKAKNPHYDTALRSYKRAMKRYPEKLLAYENKMKEYKTKLKAWKKQEAEKKKIQTEKQAEQAKKILEGLGYKVEK